MKEFFALIIMISMFIIGWSCFVIGKEKGINENIDKYVDTKAAEFERQRQISDSLVGEARKQLLMADSLGSVLHDRLLQVDSIQKDALNNQAQTRRIREMYERAYNR